MRIPIQIVADNENDKELQVVVSCRINLPHVGVIRPTFVVDTGSHISSLSYADAKINGLLVTHFPIKTSTHIGAADVNIRQLPEVRVLLVDATGVPHRFSLKQFCTEDPRVGSELEHRKAETIPSILGLSFLEETGLRLHVDMKNNSAYFEL